MFVLEDDDGEIIGTSAIYSNVGLDRPFYSYKISKITKSSPELEMRLDTEILSPVNDYTGVTEVGGLYLRPDRRGRGRGSLISLSRFLFLATHRERFPERVLAEMRGFTNDEGRSPFWDAVGTKVLPARAERCRCAQRQGVPLRGRPPPSLSALRRPPPDATPRT